MAEGSDDSDSELKSKPKYMKYDVEASKLSSSGLFYKDSDSDLEMESDSEDEKVKESLGKIFLIHITEKDKVIKTLSG